MATREPTIFEQCAATQHPHSEVWRQRARNGAWQYVLYCTRCDEKVTYAVEGKPFLSEREVRARLASDATLDDIPIMPAGGVRRCHRCKKIAYCEDHHVAEQAIHGDEAEFYPTVPLCGPCHKAATLRLQRYIEKIRRSGAA